MTSSVMLDDLRRKSDWEGKMLTLSDSKVLVMRLSCSETQRSLLYLSMLGMEYASSAMFFFWSLSVVKNQSSYGILCTTPPLD